MHLRSGLDVERFEQRQQACIDCGWSGELHAHHRKAEFRCRANLWFVVRDRFVVGHRAVAPDEGITVDGEAGRLQSMTCHRFTKARGIRVAHLREATETLEADHLDTGTHLQFGDFGQQLLEVVLPRVELGGETE
jgi:hypothetical protein